MPNYLTPEWQRADQRGPVLDRTESYLGRCSERCAVLVLDEDNPDDGLALSFARHLEDGVWYGDLGPDMNVVWWFALPPLPSNP